MVRTSRVAESHRARANRSGGNEGNGNVRRMSWRVERRLGVEEGAAAAAGCAATRLHADQPTPGLGERAHHVSRAINLETHIADVLAVLECEDLRDVVLLGHSYGGMVATGVADRAADRISKLIYLMPSCRATAKACSTCCPPRERGRRQGAGAVASGDGWLLPPNPPPPDTRPRTSPGSPRAGAGNRSAVASRSRFSSPIPAPFRRAAHPLHAPRTGDPFGQFANASRRPGLVVLRSRRQPQPECHRAWRPRAPPRSDRPMSGGDGGAPADWRRLRKV